ncbi:hypothetical protein BC834DRAFT_847207 [Gloeopeniophorella convolvens]|nr:hypothetical protein BC834DRAFT_847207 [Gloeopeniophorella convolvens]
MKKLLRTSVTKSSKSNNNKENDPDDSTEDDSQLEEQDESRDEDQPDGTRTDKEYPGQNISILADAMMNLGSKGSTASIQHWGRFAIMRAVFLKDPGSNYWDDVDAELRRIRADANKAHPTDRGKADIEVHRQINQILLTDYDIFGNPATAKKRSKRGRARTGGVQRTIDANAALLSGESVQRARGPHKKRVRRSHA